MPRPSLQHLAVTDEWHILTGFDKSSFPSILVEKISSIILVNSSSVLP